MSAQRIALLLTALATVSFAREPQAPAETIRQIAEHMRENGDVQKRLRLATQEAHLKQRAAQMKASALHRPYNAKQIEQLKQRLVSYEARFDGVQRELEVAAIEKPEERQAKLKELEVEAAAAQEAYQDAVAPFNEEREARRGDQAPLAELLDALLEPVGQTAPDLGATRADTSAQATSGSATVVWRDAERKQVAYLHLRLLHSQRGSRTEVTKLAGKHPVYRLSDDSLSFSVGTVSASFSANKAEWRDRKELPNVVLALVNFDALADLGAALAEDGDLKQQLTDCMEKEKEWQTRMRDATQGPESWRSGVNRQTNELRRPYDAKRLEQLESRLARYEQNVAGTRAELSVATIEDPEKRKSERAKADEEAKQAREEVQTAGVPLRVELVAMKRKGRYVEFAAWEMIDAVVRTPEGMGIVEADVQVRDQIANGSAHISFRDARTKQLVYAQIRFQPMPENTNAPTKLAGKYPAQLHGSSSMNFWVGGVTVTLNVRKEEWRDKDKLPELATSLLDLDAIAAWPPIQTAK